MTDEGNWIPVEVGMPNHCIDVEIKADGCELMTAWYSTHDKEWFRRGERYPALIAGVRAWRPKPPVRTEQVGCTAGGDPITMTACDPITMAVCDEPPQASYYVLELAVHGRPTKWVDMATVQRLRTALTDVLAMIREDHLIPNSVSYMKQADEALSTSPKE